MKLQDAVKLAKTAAKHANAENARHFKNHVVPEVIRPARVVWNQAIGFLFFVLAVPAALKGIQLYRAWQTDPEASTVGIVVSAIFVLVMVSFGTSSFLKARRIASRVHRP